MLSKFISIIFGPPEKRAEVSYNLGMKCFEKQDLISAEYHFKSALKNNPTLTKYKIACANILFAKGDFAGAVAGYEDAAASDEEIAILYSNWGVALRILGRLEQAFEIHKKAVDLAKDDPETLMNAFATFKAVGTEDESEALLRQVLVLVPEHADAHFQLIRMKGDSLEEEEFAKSYDLALGQEDFKAEAMLTKSERLLSAADRVDGEALLTEALGLNPELCAEIAVDERYKHARESDVFQEFLQKKPKTMYSLLIEAECTRDMEGLQRGEKKALVVLAFAKHSGEAIKNMEALLNEAGWGSFALGLPMPAEKSGIASFGKDAVYGWEQAEERGAHIYVF